MMMNDDGGNGDVDDVYDDVGDVHVVGNDHGDDDESDYAVDGDGDAAGNVRDESDVCDVGNGGVFTRMKADTAVVMLVTLMTVRTMQTLRTVKALTALMMMKMRRALRTLRVLDVLRMLGGSIY